MRKNRYKLVTILVMVLFILSTVPERSFSGDNRNTDEIISGFDDDIESEDTIRDVVDGFEDDTKEDSESGFDDDVLDGFDDEQTSASETRDTESREPFITMNGHLKLGSSYNISHEAPKPGKTDWRGLSSLRPEFQLELGKKFSNSWKCFISGKAFYDAAFEIKGREKFTSNLINAYEKDMELLEAYVQGSITGHLDIKAGRQIVVWGKSDNIRITDVLNPVDIREPGLTDIEDLRLPVSMTRLDYYTGDWNLTGIAIHEIRFNNTPEYGSDFNPAAIPLPHENIPSNGGKNTEYAVALNGTFSGWDLSFYWADMYNDMAHLELVSTGLPIQTERKHAPLEMFGTAFNAAIGSWLVKTEAAYLDGFKFFNSGSKTYSRTDLLAGIEYSGLKDITISIEVARRHINRFEDILKRAPDYASRNEFQSVFRLTAKQLNDTLELIFLASTYGLTGQDGSLHRVSAGYDLTDSINITGGVMMYQSGDRFIYNHIGDNDRIFLEIKYSF